MKRFQFSQLALRSRTLVFLTLLAVLCLSFGGGTVSAQEGEIPETSAQSEDDELGFRLGSFRLHPLASIRTVYDSNTYNSSDPTGDLSIRFQAGLRMAVATKWLLFSAQGAVDYSLFLGLEDKRTKDLSRLEGNGGLGLRIAPDFIVSFGISDSMFATSVPDSVLFYRPQDRIVNSAIADFRVQPNGKSGTLKFILRYKNVFNKYLDDANKNYNYMRHNFEFQTQWSFLPKTTVFLLGEFAIVDYLDFKADSTGTTFSTTEPKSMPVRASIGLIGRITAWLNLTIAIDYQNLLTDGLANYSMVSGRTELGFKLARRTALKIGYNRMSNPASFFGHMTSNRFSLDLSQWFYKDQFRLNIYAGYDLQTFGSPDNTFFSDSPTAFQQALKSRLSGRMDHLISGSLALKYFPLKWLSLGIGYEITYRTSSVGSFHITEAAATNGDPKTNYDFSKHQATFDLSVAY